MAQTQHAHRTVPKEPSVDSELFVGLNSFFNRPKWCINIFDDNEKRGVPRFDGPANFFFLLEKPCFRD